MIDINSSEEWDSIVRSFKEYDVYSLSGYTKAFQIHGDGLPVLFYYEGNGLRGFNVVMKRDIADDPLLRMYAPVIVTFSSPPNLM